MFLSISTLFFTLSYNFFAIDGRPSSDHHLADYVYIESTKSSYKYHDEQLRWSDAVAACSSEGAQLFYPKDEAEVQAVAAAIPIIFRRYDRIWIGISDPSATGNYVTIDGRPITEVYHKWRPGEPFSGSHNQCHWVTLLDDHSLFVHCVASYPFVCKQGPETDPDDETSTASIAGYVSVGSMNSVYKFHDEWVSWSNAVATCSSEGAQLFYPENEAEAIAVPAALHVFHGEIRYIHLGISDLDSFRHYKTLDGRSIFDVYHDWDRGEPQSGLGDHCRSVALKANNKLFVSCPEPQRFICKRPLQNQATKQTTEPSNLPSSLQQYIFLEKTKSYYKFYEDHRTWHEAKAACASDETELYYPTNAEEATAVSEAIVNWEATNAVYIAVSDLEEKHNYKTTDGKSINDVYNNWSSGEPSSESDGHYRCVIQWRDKSLTVSRCEDSRPFVCKYSPGISIQTPSEIIPDVPSNVPYITTGRPSSDHHLSDYVHIESTKSSYKYHDERLRWSDAVAACSSEGAQLFYPKDEAEVQAVAAAIPIFSGYNRIWIGISDSSATRNYVTIDGRPITEVYHKWRSGEPYSGPGNQCHWVTLFDDHSLWVGCDASYPFVCKQGPEIDPDAIIQKTKPLPSSLPQYIFLEKTRSYYKFYEDERTWQEAKAACASDGAELYYPTNSEEATAVSEAIVNWDATHAVYIAVSDLEEKHNYKTTDGRSINDVYNNWKSGEPDSGPDGRFRCVTQWKDKSLWVSRCEDSRPFVCKYSPGISIQTASEIIPDVTPSYVPYITTGSIENKLCSGVDCSQAGGPPDGSSENLHFGSVVAELLKNFPNKEKLQMMESILKVMHDHWSAAQHSCQGNQSAAPQLPPQNE